MVGVHGKAAVCRADPGHFRAEQDRRRDPRGVVPEEPDHLVPGEEGVRLGAVVGQPRQEEREIGGVQVKRIPAVLPGAAQFRPPLQQLMFDAVPAQPVAGGQAGLPRADHQGVDLLDWFCAGGGHGYFFAAFAFGALGALGGSPATCSNAFSTQARARA